MKRLISSLTILLLGIAPLCAQNVKDLILSEIQVDSVALDNGYGEKTGWIELFNSSYGTVRISGCFLTNDRNDLRKYFIPKTDSKAVIGPRQCVVFFADGDSDKGTFHTDFTLEKGQTVYIVSNDGHTIVDSLAIPADLKAGYSIAKFANDNKEIVFDDIEQTGPTPGSYQKHRLYDENGHPIEESRSEKLARTDPHGLTITLVSISVVFLALVLLYLCYSLIGAVCTGKFRKSSRRKSGEKASRRKGSTPDAETAAAIALALKMDRGSETEAAIALALHLYLNDAVHDQESYIITIKRK